MARPVILLTGAAGKVGRILRPYLRDNYDLRLCDIHEVGEISKGEEFVKGDLADASLASDCCKGVAAVVHLAALVAPAVSFEETLGPNYRATLALLESCRQQSVARFVFASTIHVFGMHPLTPLRPDAHFAPDGFYALSKIFGEAAVAMYAHRFGIGSLVIRIGNMVQPITDARRESMWISGRDLAALIHIGIEKPDLNFEVVYGTSSCPEAIFSNGHAVALGYRPLDHSAEHRSANFAESKPSSGTESTGVGGTFATTALPNPFRLR